MTPGADVPSAGDQPCTGCTHPLNAHRVHRDHPDGPFPCDIVDCPCEDFAPATPVANPAEEARIRALAEGLNAGAQLEAAGRRLCDPAEQEALRALRTAAHAGIAHADLDTTDAQVWADKFAETFLLDTDISERRAPTDGRETFILDRGTLIGWFANAIERGREAGRAATAPLTPAEEIERIAREAIVGIGGLLARAVCDALGLQLHTTAGTALAESVRTALDAELKRLAHADDTPNVTTATYEQMLNRILAEPTRHGADVRIAVDSRIPRGSAESSWQPVGEEPGRFTVRVHPHDLSALPSYDAANGRLVTVFGVFPVESEAVL